MSNVKGIISGLKDNGPTKGKFGTQWRIGFVVDGERYSGFFGKSAEGLGLEDGKLVTFTYTEKGEYKNIDPKSLKVSSVAESPQPSASGALPPKAGTKIAGVTVGMALNNATLLLANGIVKAPEGGVLVTLEKVARGILSLSAKLEAGGVPAPAPVAAAKPAPEPQEEPEGDEEEGEPEPPPPKKVVSKAPVKAPTSKPAGKAKPADDEPAYDDDVPF